jgi:hypothetical protein
MLLLLAPPARRVPQIGSLRPYALSVPPRFVPTFLAVHDIFSFPPPPSPPLKNHSVFIIDGRLESRAAFSPLSSSRPFSDSFLPFNQSSSSRHRRRRLPLFTSPFGVSQRFSHFVVIPLFLHKRCRMLCKSSPTVSY